MTLFQKYVEVFTDWDVDAFRGLHHEDFMFVRETDLLNLDEHIEIIDKLVWDGQMNWHKVASWFTKTNICSQHVGSRKGI